MKKESCIKMKTNIKTIKEILKGCGRRFDSWLDTEWNINSLVDEPTKEQIKEDKERHHEFAKKWTCGNIKLCPDCKIFLSGIKTAIQNELKFLKNWFDFEGSVGCTCENCELGRNEINSCKECLKLLEELK